MCNTVAKLYCSASKHPSLDLIPGFMENLEVVLPLKGELAKLKKQATVNLTAAVKKKKEKQQHITLVTKEAHSDYLELLNKQEDSQMLLAELMSMLKETEHQERRAATSGPSQAKDQQDRELSDLLS